MSFQTTKRFEVLDSFRGLFALCVVIYHMRFTGSLTEIDFFRSSNYFVDFFFVLSGFVLAHGYACKDNLNFKTFALSRSFRLLPLHVVMLLVFICLELAKMFAQQYGMAFENMAFSGVTSKSEILPNLFLLHGWTPYTEKLSFNHPSWSISIEFYMYMIFFASLFAKGLVRILLWLSLISVMVYLTASGSKFLVEAVPNGLYCFFSGALTYIIYKNIHHIIMFGRTIFTIFETLCLCMVIILLSSDIQYKSLIIALIFCISIFTFSFERGLLSDIFKKSIFTYLGKLSYSIYMTHAAILFILLSACMVLQKAFDLPLIHRIENIRYLDFGGALQNNIMITLVLVVVILLSTFTYKTIEQRGQKIGKNIIRLMK